MEWIKKIKNTFLKETKINDEIVVDELKELEKSYICTAHNIADRYYFDKWKSLTKNEDPIEALEIFIAAEQQILDRLKEIKSQRNWPTVKLYECHFGGAGGKNKEEEPVEYSNSTGLMWGLLREKLRRQEIELIYDDKQITQLSNRKYKINSDGKIELEKKEEMKKRGLTSPDRGDALVLSLYEPKKSVQFGYNNIM